MPTPMGKKRKSMYGFKIVAITAFEEVVLKIKIIFTSGYSYNYL